MSVLLASAPILPVYAGKQSTPSTSSGITPTTGGQTPPSTNNPGQGGGGQGGNQNTPNTPDTPNTNTATPPQVVNQLAQQRMSPGAMVGIGAAAVAGIYALGGIGIYTVGAYQKRLPNPRELMGHVNTYVSEKISLSK
jgi:hypothetical protein